MMTTGFAGAKERSLMTNRDSQPFSRMCTNPMYQTITAMQESIHGGRGVKLGSRKLNMESLDDMTVGLPTGLTALPSTAKCSRKGQVTINPDAYDRDIYHLSSSRSRYRTLNIDEFGLKSIEVEPTL